MSTDTPNGMDAFNLVTLSLLNRLYDSFPRPLNLGHQDASDIGFSAIPEYANDEQVWEMCTMTADIVEWLAEEGFLRFEKDPNHTHGVFWKVRLSLKGLAILGAIPNAVAEKAPQEPLISKIKGILKSGTQTIATESVKAVVAQLFTCALTSSVILA